jgi:di/tricarboxylate transporter
VYDASLYGFSPYVLLSIVVFMLALAMSGTKTGTRRASKLFKLIDFGERNLACWRCIGVEVDAAIISAA